MKREVEQQWRRQKDSFERKESKEQKASRSMKDKERRIIERSNGEY